MKTRNACQAVALSAILLFGMTAIAAPCKEQSLAGYVKDGSCTLNHRDHERCRPNVHSQRYQYHRRKSGGHSICQGCEDSGCDYSASSTLHREVES